MWSAVPLKMVVHDKLVDSCDVAVAVVVVAGDDDVGDDCFDLLVWIRCHHSMMFPINSLRSAFFCLSELISVWNESLC